MSERSFAPSMAPGLVLGHRRGRPDAAARLVPGGPRPVRRPRSGQEGTLSEEFPVQLAGLPPGSHLAGYRIEAPLGVGGMAVVYRAHDEQLQRPVALKVFAPVTAPDQLTRRRFLDESRAAAAVDHEHIIPIYDAGQARGYLFIAMRLVRGGDLRGLLEREGALPPARAAGIVSQVASALDAAHGAGLVHRDVKPANILLATPAGEPDYVYLSDFGVSKQATRPIDLDWHRPVPGDPRLRRAGTGPGRTAGRACRPVRAGLRGLPPADRGAAVRTREPDGCAHGPPVRAAAVGAGAAAGTARGRRSGPGPGPGQGAGRAVSVLPGVRGRAARGARPGRRPGRATDGHQHGSGLGQRPANRSWQTTQFGSVPAKGSSLLQPTPGAGPSRPGRFAADWSRSVMRLGGYGMGILVLAALVLVAFRLATYHSPKSAPVSNPSYEGVPVADGPPVNPAQQPPGVSRNIQRIVAADNKIVTTGSQTSGGVVRQQFFVSANAGATWYAGSDASAGRQSVGGWASGQLDRRRPARMAGRGSAGHLDKQERPVVDTGGYARDRSAASPETASTWSPRLRTGSWPQAGRRTRR